MKEINHANSFGVNIVGIHIPKNAIYGKTHTLKGTEFTYYTTDLESIDNAHRTFIYTYVSAYGSAFRLQRVKKDSMLGHLIMEYANENIPYGTRCIWPRYAHSFVPTEKKPQIVFLGKVSNQESIEGRGYANKLRKQRDRNGNIIPHTYEQVDFVDKGAYNGWKAW